MAGKILEVTNITKTFPGVVALKNVNLDLYEKEVLALLGENGAGKSTLIKIISGVHKPDSGEISYLGKKVFFKNPTDAIKQGISTIHQELNLFEDILLTHLHLDHAYATKIFPSATIYIHGAYKNKPYNKFGLIKSKLYLEILGSWKNIVEIDAGMKLFDSKVTVFHTPWHAKEHCSFLIESENMGKILYTGDIVMNRVEFYDIIRWLRKDDCARFINKIGKKCDYIVFTHDEYVKSSDYFRG